MSVTAKVRPNPMCNEICLYTCMLGWQKNTNILNFKVNEKIKKV